MRRAAPLAAAAALVALAAPGPAGASRSQEAVFMDDPQLLGRGAATTERTMRTIRALGADRVRVTMLWRNVAPSPGSGSRPGFDATDPSAYPQGGWDAYDRVVETAGRYGIAVHFNVTGPGPLWATADPSRGGRGVLRPKADEFRSFVIAVGRRYSGSWVDESPEPPASGGGGGGDGGGGLLPGLPTSRSADGARTRGSVRAAAAPGALPRVSSWSIWNEPNQPGWLSPQSVRRVPSSPRLYRALQDAGYAGLVASGHGADLYVLGETAPRGTRRVRSRSPMRPLLFIRDLYCVDRRLKPYRGRRAHRRGCPSTRAGRRRFVSSHPGLFRARGWAHHPYALELPPHVRDRTRDQVTLASLGRLTRTLDRIFRRYRVRRRLPIWLTEYGYQTDPPDPLVGVSWRRQADWLARAEEIAYRNRRVRSFSQFLLVDDEPNRNVAPRDPRYWGSTFQSGFITLEGRRKPAFAAWQRPINVSPRRVRRGRRVRVFGALRPAANGARLRAAIQFRRRGSRRWRTVRRLRTRNLRGYAVRRVRARSTGYWRITWAGAGRSRSVLVRVSARRR